MKTVSVFLTAVLLSIGLLSATAAENDLPAEQVVSTPASPEDNALLALAHTPWTGDLDGILKRGFIRVATANNPLYFSADGIQQRGLAIDIARELETFLEKNYAKKGQQIKVVLLPIARDQLLPAVTEGRADIAAANLTITEARSKTVAFTDPTNSGISELVITGPGAPNIASLDDLVQTSLHLRKSSSYYEHITKLNEHRAAAGKAVIPVETVDEYLEDYDLLEMVGVGVLPATIVDSHMAAIWQPVIDGLIIHENLAVNEGGEIGWAVRQQSPQLLTALNVFIKRVRKGSLLGNMMIKRYFRNPKWIKNIRSEEAIGRYHRTLEIIKRFAEKYDFDWLMITAQGYQESQLDQSKRSSVGAVGIMQVMPSTAKDPNINISDITKPENNVHAGVKYLRFLRSTYFDDPAISPLDQALFAFGAYNAGPGNMNKARGHAKKLGLDPNVWFNNVEIAAAKTIGGEPVTYVRNIYKYYVAYALLARTRSAQASAAASAEPVK